MTDLSAGWLMIICGIALIAWHLDVRAERKRGKRVIKPEDRWRW